MYPEALLSVSKEIPLRDSGGGDITVKICTKRGIKGLRQILEIKTQTNAYLCPERNGKTSLAVQWVRHQGAAYMAEGPSA